MVSATVERSVRELRRGFRRRRLASAGTRAAIAFAVVVASVLVVVPDSWPITSAVAAIGLGIVLGVVALLARLDPADTDVRLGLGGRLRTWWDARGSGAAAGPMFGWLERDLSARLAAVPLDRTRGLGRRALGPARSALLLLLLLLLLQMLVLPPMPDGIVPLGGRSGSDVASAGDRAGDGPAAADEDDPNAESTAPERAPPPRPEPQPDEPDEPEAPAPELPPEALVLDPPTRDVVVVPSFDGEGAGVTTDAQVAGLDEHAPGSAGAAAGAATSGGPPVPPVEPDAAFERAAEDAMRSRHVPLVERPFVQRWFLPRREGRR